MRALSMSVTACALLVVLLAAGAQARPDDFPAPEDYPCPTVKEVPYLGISCSDGKHWLHFDAQGQVVGYSHGPDFVGDLLGEHPETEHPTVASQQPIDVGRAVYGQRQPDCVTVADPYRIEVIYAGFSDLPDQYALKREAIRSMIREANGEFYRRNVELGVEQDLQVRCSGGDILVHKRIIPTSSASVHAGNIFDEVMADLTAAGHVDPKVKHWVFVDYTIGGIAGEGTYWPDESAVAANDNNGEQATFSMIYGRYDATAALHELTHSLGAVGDGSPHSTGAGHCTDGSDVMCYDDGGPSGGAFSETACPVMRTGSETPGFGWPVEPYDCGGDTYCHPSPVAGYLNTHWNVCSSLSRYMTRGATTGAGPPLACFETSSSHGAAPDGVGATCTADLGGATARMLRIDWGDGTVQTLGGDGSIGGVVTIEHRYATEGIYLIAAQQKGVSAADVPAAAGFSRPSLIDHWVRGDRCGPGVDPFRLAVGSTHAGLNPSGATDTDAEWLRCNYDAEIGAGVTSITIEATTAVERWLGYTRPGDATLFTCAGPGTGTLSCTISGGHPHLAPGTWRILVDNDAESEAAFSLSVTTVGAASTNGPPTADAGTDTAVSTGASFSVDAGGSHDPDGDDLRYQWRQIEGTSILPAFAKAERMNLVAPSAGVLKFQVRVHDGIAWSPWDTVIVTVGGLDADAGREQFRPLGGGIKLDASASTGTNLLFKWRQMTPGTQYLPAKYETWSKDHDIITFRGPGFPTHLRFAVQVTEAGSPGIDGAVADVYMTDSLVYVDAGPDRSRDAGKWLAVWGCDSAGRGQETYHWTVTAGPAVRWGTDDGCRATLKLPNAPAGTKIRLKLEVTDFHGVKDSDTMVITLT